MLHEIDLSRINLNLLVLFEAVFTHQHVGRAAEQLNLSPSAVSHGIGRLRRLLNDPLFLKTPRGVVPTDRATLVAPMICDLLGQVRSVIAHAEPFDPATSNRRMIIGAPDGVSAVLLDRLLPSIAADAPFIDLGIRQLLPSANEVVPDRAWRTTFSDLETTPLDIAIIPIDDGPARFAKRPLYEEDFVLIMRRDHAFRSAGSIEAYCESRHLVVSLTGDPHGFVDEVLAKHGRTRRVALTVPNFMLASVILKETDLLCAVPRRLAALYAGRLELAVEEAPIRLGQFRLNAFAPAAALLDEGISWLLDRLTLAAASL